MEPVGIADLLLPGRLALRLYYPPKPGSVRPFMMMMLMVMVRLGAGSGDAPVELQGGRLRRRALLRAAQGPQLALPRYRPGLPLCTPLPVPLPFEEGVEKEGRQVRGCWEAEPRAGSPLPILIVSHGVWGFRGNSGLLCAHLARAGFLVAALEHWFEEHCPRTLVRGLW